MSSLRFYGETPCDFTERPCRNKAYYSVNHKCLCGVHSRRFKETRTSLPVNPNKTQDRQQLLLDRQRRVEEVAALNRSQGRRGNLMLTKLFMMREPEHHDGFLKVFPNFKHQNRTDGFGCKSLSPKDLGPILHPQPNLPPALNLENFHQGNKVFESELNSQKEPSDEFFVTQRQMYESPIPLRHKPQAQRKNIPCFSIWVDASHTMHKLTYLQSRQFYCNYYQRLVEPLPDFQQLLQWLRDGYNLQIIGYDAYQPRADQSLEDCYLDETRPFGHELVLYTMLMHHMQSRPDESEESRTCDLEPYPWVKHKTFDF